VLYLPDERYLARYKVLTWALPPNLLPWLMCKRGLGIYVLPQNKTAAWKKIQWLFGQKKDVIEGDGRPASETAHYRPKDKAIVIPHSSFVRYRHNPLLHEVGHAVDYLYTRGTRTVSSYKTVKASLHLDRPFTDYCKRKDSKSTHPLEQFATGFEAYFREPAAGNEELTINDLTDEFIRIVRDKIVLPFSGASAW